MITSSIWTQFRRIIPSRSKLKQMWFFRPFGKTIFHADLWSFQQRAVAGGIALGLFIGCTPTYGIQMFIYAALAYIVRVNLPLGLASTWITNPLTVPFIYYSSYQLGVVLLGGPPPLHESEPLSGKVAIFMQIVKPLWVGSLFVGAIVSVVGYSLASFVWSLQRRLIGRKTIGEQGVGSDHGGAALDFTSSHLKPGNANPSFSRTPRTGASINRKSL